MKRKLLVAGVCALAAGAAAAVWFAPHGGGERPEARPAPTAPSATNGNTLSFQTGAPQLAFLKVAEVELAPEPLVEALPGRIAYDENSTARVGTPVAGRVARILVALGDRVEKGAALATIDSPDFSQALADRKRDELELVQKRHAFERARLLFDGGVSPRKEMEAAETEMKEAEVELRRAERRLGALGQHEDARDGEFVLRAPLAGVVTERSINPGTLVGPDTDKPLFVIADPARVRVIVDVPEQRLAVLRAGQEATVEVDAYPGRTFAARLVHVGDVLDPATRRVQVRGDVDNGDRLLKPEMYARVTPLAGGAARRPRVPNGAVVTAGVTSYVFVERSPGTFERRAITVATQGREFTYVKDGLSPGDRVVAAGALLLNSELQAH